MSNRRKLSEVRFEGPRFADNGLEIEVLPELVKYKKILVETAKELWRDKHPDRQRLPRNFEESISIKFYQINPGSAVVPLYREIFDRPGELPLEEVDELDEAVGLVDHSILAVQSNERLPANFPKEIVSLVREFGSSLADDESIWIHSEGRSAPVHFTHETRGRFAAWIAETYEDSITVTGEVRGAELDGSMFTLRLSDGSRAKGRFEPEWEEIVTEGLRDHSTRKLFLSGIGEFSRQDGSLLRILKIADLRLQYAAGTEEIQPGKPIWELVQEIGAEVPEAEWNKVPTDLAKNLDKYLYGSESEEER